MKEPVPTIAENKEENKDESEEDVDLIFKVKLDKPEPEEVKIQKKNICLVTIVHSEDNDKAEEDKQKLIEFFLQQQDPSWAQQFKNAIMLGPQFDEDNLILEDIDAYEAFCHFASIGWKVLFALIPPCSIWGGKA